MMREMKKQLMRFIRIQRQNCASCIQISQAASHNDHHCCCQFISTSYEAL